MHGGFSRAYVCKLTSPFLVCAVIAGKKSVTAQIVISRRVQVSDTVKDVHRLGLRSDTRY